MARFSSPASLEDAIALMEDPRRLTRLFVGRSDDFWLWTFLSPMLGLIMGMGVGMTVDPGAHHRMVDFVSVAATMVTAELAAQLKMAYGYWRQFKIYRHVTLGRGVVTSVSKRRLSAEFRGRWLHCDVGSYGGGLRWEEGMELAVAESAGELHVIAYPLPQGKLEEIIASSATGEQMRLESEWLERQRQAQLERERESAITYLTQMYSRGLIEREKMEGQMERLLEARDKDSLEQAMRSILGMGAPALSARSGVR